MTIEEHILMAYLDGELDAGQAARVEAQIAGDPGLAAQVARQRALRARLRQAYDAELEEPVPEALVRLALGETDGVPAASAAQPAPESPAASGPSDGGASVLAFPGTRLRSRRLRPLWTHVGALAAGVVLAVIALPLLRNEAAPWESGSQGLQARGALAKALDTGLASGPQAQGGVALSVSFRNRQDQYCRAFTLSRQQLAGLACRDAQGWRLPVLAQTPPAAQGELRTAGTALPPAVLDAIDAGMEGEALDAAGERAARDRGWR